MNTPHLSHTSPTHRNPLTGRTFVEVASSGHDWTIRSAAGFTRHATLAEAHRTARAKAPAGVPIYVKEGNA